MDANISSHFTLEIKFYIGQDFEKGFMNSIGSNRKTIVSNLNGRNLIPKFNQNGRPQTEKYIIWTNVLLAHVHYNEINS